MLLVAAIAFLGVFGYLAGGLIVAKVLLDNADSAFAAAVQHQDGIAPMIESLKGPFVAGNSGTISAAQLQQNRDTVDKAVIAADAALMQIASDDQSLSDAGASLGQDRWLTALSGSSLDRSARRLTPERRVLADARTIMGDLAKLARFTESLYDVLIDFGGVAAAAQARQLSAVEVDLAKLQADTATAISLDQAPGLPAGIDTLMHEIQAVGDNLGAQLRAAISGSRAALSAAQAAGSAELARIRAFDYKSIGTSLEAFYTPLVTAYNGDVARAAAA